MRLINKFLELDFLVYSSHKTSTQSIIATLQHSGFACRHIHLLQDISFAFDDESMDLPINEIKNRFLYSCGLYESKRGKKITIISIVRNPKNRLISSFFQSFHDDEINFFGKDIDKTTVATYNEKELYCKYIGHIIRKDLPGATESIDQMSQIFDEDIIRQLTSFRSYYIYENKLCNLIVMNFDYTTAINSLEYLNESLGIKLSETIKSNLSIDKTYFSKYMNVKKLISPKIGEFIETTYNKFYFRAF